MKLQCSHEVDEFIAKEDRVTVTRLRHRLSFVTKYYRDKLFRSEFVKKLTGYDLWEVRIDLKRVCWRFLGILRGDLLQLLIGFKKKNNKIPVRYLNRAEEISRGIK